MAVKKAKGGLPPIPVAVLNYGNASRFDINKLTEEEIGTILLHPRVQDAIGRTIHDEAKKQEVKMNEKLYDYYQLVGAMNFLRTLDIIMKIFDERKTTMKGKGFLRKYISAEELIDALIESSSDKMVDSVADGNKLSKIVDRLRDEYGQEITFWSREANTSFYCDQLNPWEDDSIFKNMTAWDIYELGVDNSCAANLLLNNASWIKALSEHKWATKTVIEGILQRANEIMEEMIRDSNSIKDSANYLRKFGINMHDYFVKAAQKFVDYEFKFRDRYVWGVKK